MDANMNEEHKPQTVDEIFRDFDGRRTAIIKALKTDVDEFYQKCDPENGNLCLYGYPNEQWEVKTPVKEKSPGFPEPAIGINFSRNGMKKDDWIRLVAIHSDSWLFSAAFFFGAKLDITDRKRLFDMINDLPTIFEALSAKELKRLETWTSLVNPASHLTESNSEGLRNKICGACEEKYAEGKFWICCDECERWFHGVCVDITSEKAEKMKRYYCSPCSFERSLQ